jgi:predicted alpha/beta superfamily hydrolase
MSREMKFLEDFQVRGITGYVSKVKFGDRTVDFWAPRNPGSHVIVAYDGQNVLDKRNIGINPHQRATWELAQSVKRIAELHHITPPTVICVYHTPYLEDNLGRVKEYTPAKYMSRKEDWALESNGLYRDKVETFIGDLDGDELIADITERIVPTITDHLGQSIDASKTAILGASMGGLAAIYATIQRPDFFHTALSFSPHWVIGGNALAEKMMSDFPAPGRHKLWMSRGTKGLDALYEESQDCADSLIRSRGYRDNHNLITRTLIKGAHTNATWARYVPAALDFWLTKG